jgi:Acyl-CoA reductase (LuxC)
MISVILTRKSLLNYKKIKHMLKDRIKSLVYLGEIIAKSIGNAQKEGLEKELHDLIENHRHTNAWFTPVFVKQSLKSILGFLMEKPLTEFVSKYTISDGFTSKRIGVVAAGNIPLVEFHDFLCIVLSGHDYVAKLSSKNNSFLPLFRKIIEQDNAALAEHISFLEEMEFMKDVDAVITTGSNNSSRYFEYYFRKHPHIIRKNRNSVAVVSENDGEKEIKALADDIFSYFGLGCRNVSKIYLPKSYKPETIIPLFDRYDFLKMHSPYMNNYTYNNAIYLINTEAFLDAGFFLMKEDANISSPLSVIHYSFYKDAEEVTNEIEQHKDSLQCVLSSNKNIPNAISFGQAQQPDIFDFADDVDTMVFLSDIK